MEEQMTLDRLAIDNRRPPAPTDAVAVIEAIPGELDTETTIPRDRPAVQPTTDGNETELAGPVPGELDETRARPGRWRRGPKRSSPRSATGRSTAPRTPDHELPRRVRVAVAATIGPRGRRSMPHRRAASTSRSRSPACVAFAARPVPSPRSSTNTSPSPTRCGEFIASAIARTAAAGSSAATASASRNLTGARSRGPAGRAGRWRTCARQCGTPSL